MVVETAPAALLVKRSAGQINVIVHAVGILVALPKILEPGELVQSLSLAAGIRVARTISRPIGASTSSELGSMGLL